MPKTFFVRKPANLDEVKFDTQRLKEIFGDKALGDYYVAKEVQLEENEFFALHDNLFSEREWVREFSNQAHPMKDDAVAAIRVSCKGSLTVLIIDPQGFDYPRYVGIELG